MNLVTENAGQAEHVFALASQLTNEGRLQEATQLLKEHLAVSSADHVARGLLGWAAFEAGDYDGAEAAYRALASLPEPNPGALYSLGVTLGRLGRIDEAGIWLGAAVTADPSFTEATHALAHLTKASYRGSRTRCTRELA
jgi:Flp pilus assembly protein TadD